MNNKLKDFRKKNNITQKALSQELGITKDYLSAIERGARTPGFKLAKEIADYFNVTVDEIFFQSKPNKMFGNQSTA